MKVELKKMKMPIAVGTKGNGMEFEVRDGKKHLGDLIVTQSRIEWCPGKTIEGNGYQVPWDELEDKLKQASGKKKR